jgi:hypothetical protein
MNPKFGVFLFIAFTGRYLGVLDRFNFRLAGEIAL